MNNVVSITAKVRALSDAELGQCATDTTRRTPLGDIVTTRKRLHERLGAIEHVTLEGPKEGRSHEHARR
jgi:hypothetical protein